VSILETLASVAFAAVILVALAVAVAWFRATQRRERQEDEARAEAERAVLEEAVAQRLATPAGFATCIVCRTAAATDAWPVVDRSWLDNITALRDLYALTPRYRVRDGMGSDFEGKVCSACKRVVAQKWNEVLADKRTAVQRLLSQHASEISQLQVAGMLAWARAEHERSRAALSAILGVSRAEMAAPALPRPAAATAPAPVAAVVVEHDAPIAMPSMQSQVSDEVVIEGSTAIAAAPSPTDSR